MIFAQRNPKPCPILDVTEVGDFKPVLLAEEADLRTDIPGYRIYKQGVLAEERTEIKDLWQDNFVAFLLGGIISLSIIITAAATFHGTGIVIEDGGQMAQQLEPVLGQWAMWFFAIGLFGAGFSSAVTAPLAAAYATTGALGWEKGMNAKGFRAIWMIVLFVGIIASGLGASPVQLIVFAQAANGILLPVSAIYLVWVMNNEKRLGEYTNTTLNNILGGIVLIVSIILGARLLYMNVVEPLLGLI